MWIFVVVEGITTNRDDRNNEDLHCYCKEFVRSIRNRKITEQGSLSTDDKYYCVVDGFDYPILETFYIVHIVVVIL